MSVNHAKIADVLTDETFRMRNTVREIERYALLRSRDASLEMHERQQWRRMVTICKRALGESDT